MTLWGKEDKTSARPKFIKLNNDGTLAQDSSGKKVVFLSKDEAQANSTKGASGPGWYSVLTTNKNTARERVRLEKLITIANETRNTILNENQNSLNASESFVPFTKSFLLNTNQSIFADAEKGTEDPQNRPGWYFTNTSPGKKINWYFYAGADNITLGNFSAYALVTTDDVSNDNAPFFAVYTARQNDAQNASSWYRSRKVFVPTAPMTVGTKYLIYFGSNPQIHTHLPRIQLVPSPVAGSNRGPQNISELVSLSSLGSNSASPVGRVKFVVDSIGIVSPTVNRDIELRLDSSDNLEDSSGLN